MGKRCHALVDSEAKRVCLNAAAGRSLSPLASLTQTPKEFDFPSEHWPPQFHHTGPLHDGFGRAPLDFPWERLSGEPLIYASMGTLQNGSEGLFKTIVEGASAPGRQIVLSIGGNLKAEQIGAVPANTIIVQHAPQIDILKRASLCITHAGLNTALEALAQGVPLVAIPVTNDQLGVGARIAYTRTGVVVTLKELSADRLRSAVNTVLEDPAMAKEHGDSNRPLRGRAASNWQPISSKQLSRFAARRTPRVPDSDGNPA